MPLPNFLIIGAAKAGTTSFYDWLRPPSQIFMPELKEPRFFAYNGQPGPLLTGEDRTVSLSSKA